MREDRAGLPRDRALRTTGDLLKGSPQFGPWRSAVGVVPHLSDAEPVSLAMMRAMLGFTCEARWLRHAHVHLLDLFPCLPKQPGYNKRLRKSAGLVRHVTRMPARDTTLWSDDVRVVDSTPVECGRFRETVKRSDPAGTGQHPRPRTPHQKAVNYEELGTFSWPPAATRIWPLTLSRHSPRTPDRSTRSSVNSVTCANELSALVICEPRATRACCH